MQVAGFAEAEFSSTHLAFLQVLGVLCRPAVLHLEEVKKA